MTTAVRNVPLPTQAERRRRSTVDARIAPIIADNAGPKAHEPAKLSETPARGVAPGRRCRRGGRRPVSATPPPSTRRRAALGGSRKALTAVALALGTFMQVLDTSIANVSIPTIAGNLGVSSDQGTWVITSFAVANGVSVPLDGLAHAALRRGAHLRRVGGAVHHRLLAVRPGLEPALADRVSRPAGRRVRAHDSRQPGASHQCIRAAKRNTALAIWSLTTLVAPIAGPLLGGYISDNYVWPWIFLINVPVGIVCALICWNNLKIAGNADPQDPIDRVGLVLLFIWVGALQIMLDKGKDLDWFNSPLIVSLLLVTVIFAWRPG